MTGKPLFEQSMNPRPAIAPGDLYIDDLLSRTQLLRPGQLCGRAEFFIGREGQFVVGEDDSYLHRRFLRISEAGGDWSIENVGNFLGAKIIPVKYPQIKYALPRGTRQLIPLGESRVYFDTAGGSYEIALTVAKSVRDSDHSDTSPRAAGGSQVTRLNFNPTQRQLQIMFALAAPLWEDPVAEPARVVPSVEDLMEQLNLTRKQITGRVDTVVRLLRQLGVPEFQETPVQVAWRLPVAKWVSENMDPLDWA